MHKQKNFSEPNQDLLKVFIRVKICKYHLIFVCSAQVRKRAADL